MNKAFYLLMTICASGSFAYALDRSDVSVRVGYYFGQAFEGENGYYPDNYEVFGRSYSNGHGPCRITLRGINLGVDVPFYRMPLETGEVRFSPSLMLGGAVNNDDDEGTLYRLMVTGKFNTKPQTVYGLVGAGLGIGDDRGETNFDGKAAFVGQLGVGVNLTQNPVGQQPFVEASFFMGGKPYRGFGIDVGLRF